MNKLALSVAAALATLAQPALAIDAPEGKVSLNANLRYENVSQDEKKDADALTMRTRLGYTTEAYKGLSATLSFEDVRTLGINDYDSIPKTPGPKDDYAVIADPQVTELDLALLTYKGSNYSATLGRQVIAWDGQRFVGHVGWRQDRQTFDALSFNYKPANDLTLKYAYITKRNRIFAEVKDVDSSDHLLNASYKGNFGKVTAYGYLLSEEDSDTFGVSYSGSTKLDSLKVIYSAEVATQDAGDYSALYTLLEAGVVVSGITFKAGYELLGSDDGEYGFSTPLATAHKFNGWADKFLSTPSEGLQDIYLSASGKAFGGKWVAAYHDFSADEASATKDDYGTELNLLYAYKFSKELKGGVKFAKYSADDLGDDTDKLWLWANASF